MKVALDEKLVSGDYLMGLLGRTAEDRLSPFVGTITAVELRLYQGPSVGITPRICENGKPIADVWLPIERVKIRA